MPVAEIDSSLIENSGDEASHFSDIGSCGSVNAGSALESSEKIVFTVDMMFHFFREVHLRHISSIHEPLDFHHPDE